MKNISLFTIIALINFSCNTADVKYYNQAYCDTPDDAFKLIHNDLERSYYVYEPDNPTTAPLPVIINFHGYGGTIDDYIQEADLRPLVNTKNVIVVYPQGSCLDGVPHWNAALPGPDNKSTTDDLGFVEALIGQLSEDYHIDLDRVYACGYSNGGMMAYALACYNSNLIAAIGSMSGVMLDTSESCVPNKAISLIKIHGTDDGIIPYFGDNDWNAVNDALNFWVNNNNTNSAPELNTIGNIARYQYLNGTDGTRVSHYKIFEGEHYWIDFEFDGDDTATLLWNFFDLYDRNGLR